jgi:7,8-dihydropterin-6-yl-methyl-4-(beta-D-ribofuranosyl)aminobenzene 5'-phosphate synthase
MINRLKLKELVEVGSFTVTILVEDYAGYDASLYAEHGFSALITKTRSDGTIFRILLDCGTSGEVLLHNMEQIGIKAGDIDVLALSHCHYDHTGGILKFLTARNGCPIAIIAHPSIRRQTWTDDPCWRLIGMPEGTYQKSTEVFDASWIHSKLPISLGDGVTWLGEIPRETPIKLAKDLLTIHDGSPAFDTLLDDTGLVLDLGTSLVVIAGCSHSGAVNIAKYCRQLFNNKKITAYIGGLHQINAPAGSGKKLGNALAAESVGCLYAGHCTGFTAEAEISMLDTIDFKKLHCGKVMHFPCEN